MKGSGWEASEFRETGVCRLWDRGDARHCGILCVSEVRASPSVCLGAFPFPTVYGSVPHQCCLQDPESVLILHFVHPYGRTSTIAFRFLFQGCGNHPCEQWVAMPLPQKGRWSSQLCCDRRVVLPGRRPRLWTIVYL